MLLTSQIGPRRPCQEATWRKVTLAVETSNPARKSSFDLQGLLACARGELFGPGNPQLPYPPMLMFDRITKISETGGSANKGEIEAELDLKPDLWFFKCHFLGDPVMPGCLGLDALWQMVGFFLGWMGGRRQGTCARRR